MPGMDVLVIEGTGPSVLQGVPWVAERMSDGYSPGQAGEILGTAAGNPGVAVAFDTGKGHGAAAVMFRAPAGGE